MTVLSRQSTKATSWRNIAGMGMLLLFALLIHFPGTGEALAHPAVSIDRNNLDQGYSTLHSPVALSEACHHQKVSKTATSLQILPPHGDHEEASAQAEYDCNACCPHEIKAEPSAYRRLKYVSNWFALQDHRDYFVERSYTTNGLMPIDDLNRSQPLVSQLNGLSGAQAEFLNTIRLLA